MAREFGPLRGVRGLRWRRPPVARPELGDPVGRVGPDAHEHILEIGPRLDVAEPTGLDQAVRDSPCGATTLGREVQVVLSVRRSCA